MKMFGFKTSELLFLVVLLCIPVIIAKDLFWYLSTAAALTYAGHVIYMKVAVKRINIKGQGVFITGCDSGFGFGLAKHLDKLGFTVFAGCLFKEGDRANNLKASTTGRMHVIELDVTKVDSVNKAVSYVSNKVAETGLLAIVNNAGIQGYGEVEFCTMNVYHTLAEVNLFGLVRTTKAFLPLIRKYKGRIINVTSVHGRFMVPSHAAYGITKFGAETFSDILRLEMRKFGVKVIIVEPGHFAGITGIVRNENLSRIKAQHDTMWEAANEEVKNTYGRKYYDMLYKSVDGCRPYSRPTIEPVIEALEDAITNENPDYRYLVDGASAMIDIICNRRVTKAGWQCTAIVFSLDYHRQRRGKMPRWIALRGVQTWPKLTMNVKHPALVFIYVLSRIKAQHDTMWEAANEEVKNTYGRKYYDMLYKSVDGCRPYSRPTIEPVIEALEDAITNENPDYRYLVDGASAMIDIICISTVLSKFHSQRYIFQDIAGNLLMFSYKTPSESYIECCLYCLLEVSCLGVVFDGKTKTCKSYTDICTCEVDAIDPKSKKVMTKEPTCDKGWVAMYGHCFFIGLSPTKTWEDAQVDCLKRCSNLAKIDNECETSCISVYLRGQYKLEDYYWIGANDINTEGLFVWSVDNTSITYNDWAPGDPNNYDNGIEDEDCVAFNTISYYRNFGWIDEGCGKTRSYFCEK